MPLFFTYGKISFCVILLLVFWVYSPNLQHNFVWDDYDFILNWPTIRQPVENFYTLLHGELPATHEGPYRPVRSLLYGISYQIWGTNPQGYQLQAISVHLVTVILVYLLLKSLLDNNFIAQTASFIFAFHPLHAEAVSWITANFDIFGFIFALLSLLFFLQDLKSRSQLLRLVSIIFAILATYTFELTLILPVLMYQVIALKKPHHCFSQRIRLLFPYILISASYFIVKSSLNLSSPHLSYTFPTINEKLILAAILLGKYLQLMMIPVDLNINHQFLPQLSNFFDLDYNHLLPPPDLSLTQPLIYFSLILIIAFASMAFLARKRLPLISFSFIWIVISLLPVLQFLPQRGIFAERYTYFALIGFSILTAELLRMFYSFLRHYFGVFSWFFIPVFIFVFIISASSTLRFHAQKFTHNLTLWTSSMYQNPQSAGIKNALAGEYLNQQKYQLAKIYLELGTAQNPTIPSLQRNLIITYYFLGEHTKLIPFAVKYLAQFPQDYPIRLALAESYETNNQLKLAREIYISILNTSPDNPLVSEKLMNLGKHGL